VTGPNLSQYLKKLKISDYDLLNFLIANTLMIKLNSFTVSKMKTLSTNDLIRNLFDLLAFKYQTLEMQYLPITEELAIKKN